MKYLNKFLAIVICCMIVLTMMNRIFVAETNIQSEEIQSYSVPVVSNNAYNIKYANFYEIDGKYYLSFDDIKEFTRFSLEETESTITLRQGLREIIIDKDTGHLNDSDLVDQGNINIVEIKGKYFCEGIPMLVYLGADCRISDNMILDILMPDITIWESIMPDYLEYNFNIVELYKGEGNIKFSLVLDVIADILDGVSGHGIFADSDNHLEDALYEILNVDMMKYETVQTAMTTQNLEINNFLSSESIKSFIDASSYSLDTIEELLKYYGDFYLNVEIDKNNYRWQRSFKSGDLEEASDLSKKINQQICEQFEIKGNLQKYSEISDVLDIGMIGLDAAIMSYNLLQYDDDTRNLFSRTINEKIFEYTGYNDISWKNVTDKITRDLSSNESIVSTSICDSVVNYIGDELSDNGAKVLLSKFTSKANIYVLAMQIGTFIASLINYDLNQAFSADMNAIYLGTIINDMAILLSSMLVNERDEYHFSSIETLTYLKDMFTLYYRTIIAFSENIALSIEEFGGKNKDEVVEWFSGKSGNTVSNYAASYLYNITNCKIVPIVNYLELKDELLNPDWIQQFKNEDMTDTYIEFMKTKEYESYISDWIFGEPTHYAILDIDEDGIDELIITGGDGMGFYNLIVFGYDRKLKEIYPISNIDSVTYREGKENYVFQYYGGLNYSQSHKALVLSELRTGSVFGGLSYFTIKNQELVSDFGIWYEYDYQTNKTTYGYSESGNRIAVDEDEYQEYLNELNESSDPEFQPIPKEGATEVSIEEYFGGDFDKKLISIRPLYDSAANAVIKIGDYNNSPDENVTWSVIYSVLNTFSERTPTSESVKHELGSAIKVNTNELVDLHNEIFANKITSLPALGSYYTDNEYSGISYSEEEDVYYFINATGGGYFGEFKDGYVLENGNAVLEFSVENIVGEHMGDCRIEITPDSGSRFGYTIVSAVKI